VRIGYLDCVGGISGDMFVGALLDAGWPEEKFRQTVAWLDSEIAELHVEQRAHQSLSGVGIRVVPRPMPAADPGEDVSGSHGAHHGAHGHEAPDAQRGRDHGRSPGVARNLADVVARLEEAPLDPAVRERAHEVFRRLAEAEAHAHGKSVAEVHFHEVGAVDAMVDVVSVCQGLTDLGIQVLYIDSLPVGRGTIPAAHGTIPLPAPATAHLLSGAPVRWVSGDGERTTPTGAALATTFARWGRPPAMRLETVGTGAGQRGLPDVPNLARLFVGETLEGAASRHEESGAIGNWGLPAWGWTTGPGAPGARPSEAPAAACPGSWHQVCVLAAQIDDATPEEIAGWAADLRADGALDVTVAAVSMKKDRSGHLLTVICRPEMERGLVTRLLRDSSTLGVRRAVEWRRELERRLRTVDTSFGPVKAKLALRGERWVGKPEFASCREVAEAAGVPFRDVWRAALGALEADDG
jgi:uncharacterized protein (TIGR00299 family) protein